MNTPSAASAPTVAPEYSFILALYNGVALSQACLASLLASLPPSLSCEILLADDGSTDETSAWLDTLTDPRCIRISDTRNLGYAGNNNRAARFARGRWLVLLNNDLVFPAGWWAPFASALARPEFGVLGNVQYRVRDHALDHAGIAISAKAKPYHRQDLHPWERGVRSVSAVTGACLALRRETWLTLGGFDEGFRNGGEDVELCFRVRALGLAVGAAVESWVWHHVSPSPGRKQFDEANSRRLARKWRATLILLGVRAWCEQHLLRDASYATAFDHPFESLHMAAYVAGWASLPPTLAIRGLEEAMQVEERRWESLLGPAIR